MVLDKLREVRTKTRCQGETVRAGDRSSGSRQSFALGRSLHLCAASIFSAKVSAPPDSEDLFKMAKIKMLCKPKNKKRL